MRVTASGAFADFKDDPPAPAVATISVPYSAYARCQLQV